MLSANDTNANRNHLAMDIFGESSKSKSCEGMAHLLQHKSSCFFKSTDSLLVKTRNYSTNSRAHLLTRRQKLRHEYLCLVLMFRVFVFERMFGRQIF